MLKKRIFIAINLPENIKKIIAQCQKEWQGMPFRLVPVQNLHLTLEFLGYISEQELEKIKKIISEIVIEFKIFNIEFEKICLGPQETRPRLVWLKGKPNKNLSALKDKLDNVLVNASLYKKENRPILPHITLARIKEWEWRRLFKKPEIDIPINLSIEVKCLEIMESILKPSGTEYKIIDSYPLILL